MNFSRSGLGTVFLFMLLSGIVQAANIFSDEERAWIANKKEIKIGFDHNWKPVEYLQSGEFKGISQQYLQKISEISGLKFVPAPNVNGWEDFRWALKERKMDLMTATSKEFQVPEFTDNVLFSQPFYSGVTAIVTKAEESVIFDVRQLHGKTVVVKAHGAYEYYFQNRLPEIKLLTANSPEQALAMVASGVADAAIDIDIVLLPLIKRVYFGRLHVAGVIGDIPANLRFGVWSNEPLLLSIINKSLATFTAKETDLVLEHWLDTTDYGSPSWRVIVQYYKTETIVIVVSVLCFMVLIFWALVSQRRAVQNKREKAMFLAIMSHEIRTPMNAILSSVELLQRLGLDGEKLRLTNIAVQATNSLLELLDDVLDYSKLEAGALILKSEPVDIKATISFSLEVMEARAQEKGIRLISSVYDLDEMWPVLDGNRVRQLVNNLLSNALKFTEQGAISVSARLEVDLTNTQVNNGILHLSIRDTGIGIAKKNQGKLFRSFVQAESSIARRYGGTGLGLALCKEILHQFKGSIRLESSIGVGSTFFVEIPCAVVAAPTQENIVSTDLITPTLLQAQRRKEVILVVEDQPENRYIIERQLAELGYTVFTAEDGRDAIFKVKDTKFDMIFLDCNLPDIDGYTVAKKIRAMEANTNQHTPILAISAMTGPEHEGTCLDAGMDGVLSKPLRMNALQAAVELWCDSSGPSTLASLDSEILNEKDIRLRVIESIQHDLMAMQVSLSQGDYRKVEWHAHRIKGGALTFSMTELSDIAGDIESIIQQGATVDEVKTRIQTLQKIMLDETY